MFDPQNLLQNAPLKVHKNCNPSYKLLRVRLLQLLMSSLCVISESENFSILPDYMILCY